MVRILIALFLVTQLGACMIVPLDYGHRGGHGHRHHGDDWGERHHHDGSRGPGEYRYRR